LVAKSVIIQDVTTQLLLEGSSELFLVTNNVQNNDLVIKDDSPELVIEDASEAIQIVAAAIQGPRGIPGTNSVVYARHNLEFVVTDASVDLVLQLADVPATNWCSVFVQGLLLAPSRYTQISSVLTIRAQDLSVGYVVAVEYVTIS
jgi:hypothetical protein